MKLLINVCTVFCRTKKNAQLCIYSLAADPNIGHCVEFTFLEGISWVDSYVNFLKMKFFKLIAL